MCSKFEHILCDRLRDIDMVSWQGEIFLNAKICLNTLPWQKILFDYISSCGPVETFGRHGHGRGSWYRELSWHSRKKSRKSHGVTLSGCPSSHSLGFEDEDLGSSPVWWAATVATYCPSRLGELCKFLSSKPCEWSDAPRGRYISLTFTICCSPRHNFN